jgi:ATP-binding cassette subfamily B protein
LCRDWAERAAHHFGLEVAPAEVAEDDLAAICEQSPLILPETNPEGMMTGFIVVLGTRFPLVSRREPTQVVILTPDGESACIAATELFTPNPTMGDCDALRAILSEAGVEARRRERACRLLRPLLGPEHGREIWRLIPRTAGRIGPAMLQAAGPALPLFIASQALATFLWLLSWWVIGAQTLAGRIDLGWAGAWVLCLLSLVPLQLLGLWAEGLASIRVGSFLRRRFLWGALELDPERIRHLGAGMLFGRIVEAQNFEGLALSGGFLTLSALIELVAAAVVLALGAGAGAHAFLLALFALAAAGLGVNHWHKRQQSADARLHLTHMLVERMVGHRTRLALLSPDRWPEEEDPELAHYARASAASDGTVPRLIAGLPRAWLVASLLALLPVMVRGAEAGPLAAALGGTLFGFVALTDWCHGLVSASGAVIAWRRGAIMLVSSPAGAEVDASPAAPVMPLASSQNDPRATGATDDRTSPPLIDACNLWFRYAGRPAPALAGASLRIYSGDRIALHGPSGGGKSTLVSVLAGQRIATGGRLLLQGLDRSTLGFSEWRRRVALAPQFHENYLLSESLAFNLLLGRGWPPSDRDLQEALALCLDLGLGELVARMPGGLFQWVGETGWQLSHGERSRVYLARAILQGAQVVLLDESLSALDAETLGRCFRVAADRSPALVIVTHG